MGGCIGMKRANQILNIIMGAFIVFFIGHAIYIVWNYNTNPEFYGMQSAPWYTGILVDGVFTIIFEVVCLIIKLFIKLWNIKSRLMYLILPVITLILEILPFGAVLNFANPEGEPWRKTFSYFSLTPFGYANFAPFLTAIMTCIAFILLVIFCITGKERILLNARNIVCAGFVISFGPLLFGIHNFSIIGFFISVTLVLEFVLIYFSIKRVGANYYEK